jgi:hypothetical protein
MSKYEFTLIVDGPDLQDESLVESMFEAGFDDATIGRVGSIRYLDFDRGAESFADAVFSAAKSLESAVPGARVVQLDLDDLVTMSEIAERVGRTRASVRLLINGDRGPGGFPAPATHFRRRQRMWRWHEVAVWLTNQLGETQPFDPGQAHFFIAFNAGLKWREVEKDLQRRISRVVS